MKKFDDEEFRRDPQFLNRYAYVQNNPVMYTDPSGRFTWRVWLAIGGAITGGIYNALFHVEHNKDWTYESLFYSFLRGAAAGSIIGFLSGLPQAWIDGLIGAFTGIAGKIVSNARLEKETSVADVTKAAIAGWSGGVMPTPINKYLPWDYVKGTVATFSGGVVSSYVGAW